MIMVQNPAVKPSQSAPSQSAWESEAPNWDSLEEEWLSDEPELESDLHRDQIDLLLRLMKNYWRDSQRDGKAERNDIYCSGNTTVYYDPEQRTNRNFRGPDIYVVLGAERRSRNSWMVWREGGKYPNVVIELLSDSTAKVDRTTKKDLYQDVWRLPEYFWFHPYTKEFKGFRLESGKYQALQPNEAGWLWSEQLNLFLGLLEEELRLFTATGELVLQPEEEATIAKEQAQRQAEQAQQQAEQLQRQAEQAQRQAEQERQQKERLAERLRQLGVDPDEIGD
jgi:Uma2 family endonuclease